MASPPESTPDKYNNNEYSEEKRSSSDSSNSSPSSSQSTSSSLPPNSSPPQKSPPAPPPSKSSSPPPPPPESPSPPQQDAKPPSSSSPPPEQESSQPTVTPNVAQSLPPKPTTPVVMPLPTTTTTTPNSIPGAAVTAPGGVFYPPPPIGSLSPASSATEEKSPSSSKPLSSGSKHSPAPDPTQSTVNAAIMAGITAACILLIAFIILTITCLFKKKKQYRNAPPKGGDQYYGTQTQWHSPEGHIVQIPPPQGVIGTPGGGGGGGCMPQRTSSEFNSNSSGTGHAAGYQTPPMPGQQSPNMGLGLSKSQFTYDELAAATGGFSQANILGQGGFGYVYKGVLPNGQIVAVKRLKSGSGQGEREFQAEVEIISRVHHRHLVSLVGYCIADGQRMLVYEYVSNKTMEFHLHGAGRPVMDWPTRLRIALGSAKGLGYLHEDCHPKIIHRDIKAANILLDDKYEAMVADFGLAKLSEDNNTHVSTRVMGTFGYLAPEYASSGKLTEKSDVFSFGVMLLELITGQRPVDNSHKFNDDSLVDWARPVLAKAIEDGNYKDLVDPRLEDNFDPDEMVHMVACAAACIRHSARRRPKMTQIVRTLDGDSSLDDLNEGGKAGQVVSAGETRVYDTGAYNADMLKFKQLVMSSQEFISGEFTTEFVSSSRGDSGGGGGDDDGGGGGTDSDTQRQKHM